MKILENFDKPVRDIGIGGRGIRGSVPGLGKYESTLERDFMEILRFDFDVEKFIAQPLTISYFDKNGMGRKYTPDGLVFFRPRGSLNASPQPLLYEVKFRADFRKCWRELIPKFRAAKAVAFERNWRFEVFTESEIRTPYLANTRFLLQYRERVVPEWTVALILSTLWDLDEADPDLLLCALCRDPENRARLIPAIWHLVSRKLIGCNLDEPLTMRTKIWVDEVYV